jgi:hypothetical protein
MTCFKLDVKESWCDVRRKIIGKRKLGKCMSHSPTKEEEAKPLAEITCR